MNKDEKATAVAELTETFGRARLAIVTESAGLSVNQVTELRKQLRGAKAEYKVVKNTLAELASKGPKIEEGLKNLTGVTSIAYTSGDPVALAKVLSKYAKENPEFTFKAGVVEGRVVTVKDIEALGLRYDPWRTNCNAVVSTLVERSGHSLPSPSRRGWFPAYKSVIL